MELKASVTQKEEKFLTSEEVKLWFPISDKGANLCFRSKGNELKLHYDHGTRKFLDKELNSNYYASIESNRVL